MEKIDFKKTLASYQAKRNQFTIVTVPELRYLMIDGHGDPNTSEDFSDALTALYPVAYKLKFASKNDLGRDYMVPPLEALWWSDDMAVFTSARDKSRWNWTAMLLTPDWITQDMFASALETVAAKDAPASLGKLRLESLTEGTCAQTLHIGSFDDEGPVLAKMHDEFIPGQGMKMVGKHHEVYFSDFRKVEPSKLRTLLRQPVAPVA